MAMALGADAFAINPFTATGYGKLQRDQFQLSRKQLQTFLDKAQSLAQKIPIPMLVTLPVEDCVIAHASYPNLRFSSCQCGVEKWVIDPLGDLRTCEQNHEHIGSLLEHSFTLLSAKASVKAFRDHNRKPECSICPKYIDCGGGCRFRIS